MASSAARMNGAQAFQAGIVINYSGVQDWTANLSRFDWQVWLYRPAGWTSWTNSTCSWSASIGGNAYGGTFTVPSSTQNSNLLVASGSTWIGHDAAGYRPGFPSSSYLSVPHSSIGSGGSGDAWVDAPRIPKPPGPTTPLGIDMVTSSSLRYRFSGGDNGGSAITNWKIRWSLAADMSSPTQINAATGTDTISGLPAGTEIFVQSGGDNARGPGPWSSIISAVTLAGPPSVPTSVNPTTTPPDKIKIEWDAPASTGGKPITGYDVQASLDPTFATGVIGGSTAAAVEEYEWSGLQPGSVYAVRVRAKNADANGPYSSALNVLIPAGGKVWTGSIWKSALWKVWTGSIWKVAIVKVWTGSTWKVAK